MVDRGFPACRRDVGMAEWSQSPRRPWHAPSMAVASKRHEDLVKPHSAAPRKPDRKGANSASPALSVSGHRCELSVRYSRLWRATCHRRLTHANRSALRWVRPASPAHSGPPLSDNQILRPDTSDELAAPEECRGILVERLAATKRDNTLTIRPGLDEVHLGSVPAGGEMTL